MSGKLRAPKISATSKLGSLGHEMVYILQVESSAT
jgi:hypothetical protein